jgi:SAM-dependent methyltransferase
MTSDYGNLQKHLNPNPLQRFLLRRFQRRVAALVRQSGARRILDAGCGEGFTLRHLQESDGGAWLLGIDNGFPALRWAAAMVPAARLALADVRELPFGDGSFELVLCLEVLEHLPDPQRGLEELWRVSNDYCLLSVPHEPFFRAVNFLRGKHLPAWGNDPEHLQSWTAGGFRRFVESVWEVVWFGFSFPWLVALGRKRGAGS